MRLGSSFHLVKRLKGRRIISNKKLLIPLVVLACIFTGTALAALAIRNNSSTQASSSQNINSNSAPVNKSSSQTMTLPKTQAQSQQPVSNSTRAQASRAAEYQREADEAGAKAVEIQRCMSAVTSANQTEEFTRNIVYNDITWRINLALKDNRLSLSQSGAIIRYNYEKYNKTVNNAYQTYLSTLSRQNCTPSHGAPYNYPPTNYPDLSTNYPYLADYPNVDWP